MISSKEVDCVHRIGKSSRYPLSCIAVLVAILVAPASALALEWGPLKNEGCSGAGFARWAAVLWNIPSGASWENTCKTASLRHNDQDYPTVECVNENGVRMWGKFDLPSENCSLTTNFKWGDLKREGCDGPGTSRYSAVLWGIPAGYNWEAACKAKLLPHTDGKEYKATCEQINQGVNIWGRFSLPDAACQVDIPALGKR